MSISMILPNIISLSILEITNQIQVMPILMTLIDIISLPFPRMAN